jgi:hypothetical protein
VTSSRRFGRTKIENVFRCRVGDHSYVCGLFDPTALRRGQAVSRQQRPACVGRGGLHIQAQLPGHVAHSLLLTRLSAAQPIEASWRSALAAREIKELIHNSSVEAERQRHRLRVEQLRGHKNAAAKKLSFILECGLIWNSDHSAAVAIAAFDGCGRERICQETEKHSGAFSIAAAPTARESGNARHTRA